MFSKLFKSKMFFFIMVLLNSELSLGYNIYYRLLKNMDQYDNYSGEKSMKASHSRVDKPHEFIPDVPDICEDESYCDEVLNYPVEHAERLVQKILNEPSYKEELRYGITYQVKDMEGKPKPVVYQLCDSTKMNITPKAIRDRDGDWVFVLTPSKTSFPAYEVEFCTIHSKFEATTNQPCNLDIVYFQGDYSGYCFQNYIKELFHTIDRKSGELRLTEHALPSGCSCEAVKNFASLEDSN